MPHGESQFTWFAYVFQFSQLLFLLGAVVLIIDGFRISRRADDKRLRAAGRRKVSLTAYQIVCLIALIFHLAAYLPNTPEILSMISLFASPVLLLIFFAYLLNIVFYKKTDQEVAQLIEDRAHKRASQKNRGQRKTPDSDVHDFVFDSELDENEDRGTHESR